MSSSKQTHKWGEKKYLTRKLVRIFLTSFLRAPNSHLTQGGPTATLLQGKQGTENQPPRSAWNGTHTKPPIKSEHVATQ